MHRGGLANRTTLLAISTRADHPKAFQQLNSVNLNRPVSYGPLFLNNLDVLVHSRQINKSLTYLLTPVQILLPRRGRQCCTRRLPVLSVCLLAGLTQKAVDEF